MWGVYIGGGEQGHMRDPPSHPVNSQGARSVHVGPQACWRRGDASFRPHGGHSPEVPGNLDLRSSLGRKKVKGRSGAHGGRWASSEASGEVVVVRAYKGLLTGPSGRRADVGACITRSIVDLGPESGLMLRAKVRPARNPEL